MEQEIKALQKKENKAVASPLFVEAEKLFDRFAEISRDIGKRAFKFFQERGDMWGDQLEDWFKAESELLRPAPVEITENDKTITVKAAVPGFAPDEIEVSVKDDILMMTGKAGTELKSEDEKTFYSEWKSDRFMRKLKLPTAVEPEGIRAELKDGILTLTMSKRAEKEAAKIAVRSA